MIIDFVVMSLLLNVKVIRPPYFGLKIPVFNMSSLLVFKFLFLFMCLDQARWNYKTCCASSIPTILNLNKWFKPSATGEYIQVNLSEYENHVWSPQNPVSQ